MAITDKTVEWLNQNIIVSEDTGLRNGETRSCVNWKMRFQDFNDRNLQAYFNRNDGERRWIWILHDLSEKARNANRHDIENHLNGFEDEADYQHFLKHLEEMAVELS